MCGFKLNRERDNEKLRLDIDKLMRDLLANQKQDQAAEIDTVVILLLLLFY